MIPAGEIVEVVGPLSSGRTSLLAACLAHATARGALAAVVDADEVFDPASAVRAGVDLRRILWVRCRGRRPLALRAADLLVRCPGFALVALDLGEVAPRLSLAAAFRLRLAAWRTGAAVVVLASRRVVGAGAFLAVRTRRRAVAWTGTEPAPTRLASLTTDVHVVRRRGGPDAAPLPTRWRWCA
jgi:hypothetical protein